MKMVVEEVLEWKKMIPTLEEQHHRKYPFAVDILERLLPMKFKMPQITPILAKMILMITFKIMSC